MKTLLDTFEDMIWLREVHLPKLAGRFVNGSALLFGNEDCPRRIWVFEKREPNYFEIPLIFALDEATGEYTGTRWE